jgi:adenosine deaminase
MRHATLVELAERNGSNLPPRLALEPDGPPSLGWPRFQRLYDIARSALRTVDDLDRLVNELVDDEVLAGSRWVELQVTPTSYARIAGDIVAVVECLLELLANASVRTGVGTGLVIAVDRTRPPWEAMTLARLAARYADSGVVGFGLSNDERRGPPADFERAFAIARRAGLLSVPHAGELRGPDGVREALLHLHADRLGHGVRSVEDETLLRELADREITCEVCPLSNIALGVAATPAEHPLEAMLDAGVPVSLGADDPLLFGAHLLDAYEFAITHAHVDTRSLAALARTSVRSAGAPAAVKQQLLAEIDGWLG